MSSLKYSKIDDSASAKRQQLRRVMDNFCTFGFDNLTPDQMFEKYGAFIINDKNSLKFYNGPGFSNDYTKPQFAKYTQLAGVSFKTQQIKFKIGLYWFDIKTYRNFLNEVLNPLKIGNLVFSFSPQWCYQVKLSNIADSVRYVVGYMKTDSNNEEDQYAYYTEFDTTWDIQGEACARAVEPCKVIVDSSNNQSLKYYIDDSNRLSDLPTPFVLSFTLDLTGVEQNEVNINLLANYESNNGILTTTLAQFTLYNWIHDITDTGLDPNLYQINLTYNSENGVVYYTYGNAQNKLLNSLNTTSSGKKLVTNLWINKFVFPGYLDNISNFTWDKISIQLVTNAGQLLTHEDINHIDLDYGLEIYQRTNVL